MISTVETTLFQETGIQQPNLDIQTAFEIARRITGVQNNDLMLTAGKVRETLLGMKGDSDYDFIGPIDLDIVTKKSGKAVLGRWDILGVIKIKVGNADFDFINRGDNLQQRLAINDLDISTLCLTQGGLITDYFGGLESLSKKIVRMHEPISKIEDDPSRILRVIRFASFLGFQIEENTLEAVISRRHLLKRSDNVDDLWRIFGLDEQSKQIALDMIKLHQLDKYISIPTNNGREYYTAYKVENELERVVPSREILNIFNHGEFYLIGGSVRDVVWEKPIRDFDFKTNLTTGQMILALQNCGYKQTENLNLLKDEYYINQRTGSVSLLINGIDIDLTHTENLNPQDIFEHGDVNFSCGVYNIRTGKILNPKQVFDIKNKVIEFCNPEKALNDPLIVVNALKQISRDPGISVPALTLSVIQNALPKVIDYFQFHPKMLYKMSSLGGNLNSGHVKDLFSGFYGGIELFEKCCHQKQKLKVSSSFVSESIGKLSKQNKQKIVNLITQSFADRYDPKKVYCSKITSAVYKMENENLVSCCLISGERIYAPAATCGQNWIEIVTDLIKCNYNIWMTVDAKNLKIQTLVSMAGLKMEHDPIVIKKILTYNDQKNPDDILVSNQNGITIYEKIGQSDYPQVLFRS